MFTLQLLQAINDWQKAGFGKSKDILAEEIKKYSVELPLRFKTLDKICYRKLNLRGNFIYEIGINFKIQETYSSWTFNSQIAKDFNGGVPSRESGEIGFIFEWNPTQFLDFEVIINLNEVFQSVEFEQACESFESSIYDYDLGIARYKNTEQEIILKVLELKIEQIWAYGGYGNKSVEEHYEYIKKIKGITFEQFKKIIIIDKIPIGQPFWLTKEINPDKVQGLIEKNKKYAHAIMFKKQAYNDSNVHSN